MYAIICWKTNEEIYPMVNANGTIKLFDKLSEANGEAKNYLDADSYRVISIKSVHE